VGVISPCTFFHIAGICVRHALLMDDGKDEYVSRQKKKKKMWKGRGVD
jgi:hypothetical protein